MFQVAELRSFSAAARGIPWDRCWSFLPQSQVTGHSHFGGRKPFGGRRSTRGVSLSGGATATLLRSQVSGCVSPEPRRRNFRRETLKAAPPLAGWPPPGQSAPTSLDAAPIAADRRSKVKNLSLSHLTEAAQETRIPLHSPYGAKCHNTLKV